VGGMAAIPSRARSTEACLIGRTFSLETFTQAKHSMLAEFQPLTDMRATAEYRRQVAGNLMLRFWREIAQPEQANSLETFDAKPVLWLAQDRESQASLSDQGRTQHTGGGA
jgi:xanthine dehydrogenase small subunit